MRLPRFRMWPGKSIARSRKKYCKRANAFAWQPRYLLTVPLYLWTHRLAVPLMDSRSDPNISICWAGRILWALICERHYRPNWGVVNPTSKRKLVFISTNTKWQNKTRFQVRPEQHQVKVYSQSNSGTSHWPCLRFCCAINSIRPDRAGHGNSLSAASLCYCEINLKKMWIDHQNRYSFWW